MTSDQRAGLQKIAKVYHYPSYWDACGQITIYVNTKTWDALSKDYHRISEMACSNAHVDMQAKYDTPNPEALRRLVASGVSVRPFPGEEGTSAWKAANELYVELSSTNGKWKNIFDNFTKHRDDQILWP